MHGIRTRRMLLRRARRLDCKPVQQLFSQEPVYRYFCDGEPPPLELVHSWIAKSDALFDAHGVGLFVAQQGNETVGLTGFFEFHDPPVIEFLFAVAPPLVGQGYANEIGQTMLPLGLELLGEVHASTDAPNERSIRALERLGFLETLRTRKPEADHETVHFELPK